MSKFFFDVYNGVCHFPDFEGQKFCDKDAASQEATGVLADIARDLALKGKCSDLTVDMSDETGHVVFTATLSVKTRMGDLEEDVRATGHATIRSASP